MAEEKNNTWFIVLLFLLGYIIPLVYLFQFYSPTLGFLARLLGLLALLNVIVQVLLGSFRLFFIQRFNANFIVKFHNYLGLTTLIISLIHVIYHLFFTTGFFNPLILASGLGINLGVIALYFMLVTVITSDLKFFFNVNINQKVWRLIHLLNYSLFPLLLAHSYYLSALLANSLMFYFFLACLIIVTISALYRIKTKLLK
jgi:predicted ferric reductase